MLRSRVSRTIAAAALGAGMLLATATPAHAASTRIEGRRHASHAYATTYRAGVDGGTYAVFKVLDKAADGKCAHAALAWLHKNGKYYYDYGVWVCGKGKTAQRNTYASRRNASKYQLVKLQVWADGDARRSVVLQRF